MADPAAEAEVAAAIDEHFGSFDGFKGQFEAAGTTIQGSGWAVLSWDAVSQAPRVFQLWDQQGNVPIGQTPLLMLDMWEHAYYLQYKNDKATFVKQWWNIVNWADVQQRYARAATQTPGLIVP